MGIYSGIACDSCGGIIHKTCLMTERELIGLARGKGWLADGRILCAICQSRQGGVADEIKEISDGLTEENKKYVHAVASALLYSQDKG